MKTKNICTLRYNLPQGCGPYRLFDPTISEPGKNVLFTVDPQKVSAANFYSDQCHKLAVVNKYRSCAGSHQVVWAVLQRIRAESCEEPQGDPPACHSFPSRGSDSTFHALYRFLAFPHASVSEKQSDRLPTSACTEDIENKISLSSHWGKASTC